MTAQWLPTGPQTLLLQAALFSDETAEDAFSQWRSTVELDHIDGGSFRLLPLLSRSLELWGDIHPSLDRIRGVYRRSVYTSTMLRVMAGSVINELEQSGVCPVVINGSAIAHLAYDDSATRPLGDVDLFVTPPELIAALAILEDLGFRSAASRHDVERGASTVFGAALSRGPAEKLRLHTSLRGFGLDPNFDQRALKRTSVRPVGHVRRTLDPTDHLLRTLINAPQPRAVPNCRWAADVICLVRNAGPIEWPRLVDDAYTLGLIRGVGEALTYLERNLRLRLPADVRQALDAKRMSPVDRLQHWAQSTPATRRSSAIRLLLTDYRYRAAGRPVHRWVTEYPRYLSSTIAARQQTNGRSLLGMLRHGPRGD